MTDFIDLALRYGGYTTLDKVYLSHRLKGLSPQQKYQLITPPPSVINAYFAEIYDKQSPQVATDYYFELSKALHLFNSEPSFEEVLPFVRLNLLGKSYGFVYPADDVSRAMVFAETPEPISPELLLAIAKIFPHYGVSVVEERISLVPPVKKTAVIADITPESTLLGRVERLSDGRVRISSFNQEEFLTLLEFCQGQIVYQVEERAFVAYGMI